jgi:hypothetical protein
MRLLDALAVILERAGKMGVRYTLEKCRFFVKEILMSRPSTSRAGRRIPESRMSGISNLQAPSNKAELLSAPFGLFGHFRKYSS